MSYLLIYGHALPGGLASVSIHTSLTVCKKPEVKTCLSCIFITPFFRDYLSLGSLVYKYLEASIYYFLVWKI